MIRDRLVVGIRNNSLSEQLQMDADLMLEKAKKAIRQKEAVHGQQSVLNNDTTASPIDTVKSGSSSLLQSSSDLHDVTVNHSKAQNTVRGAENLCTAEINVPHENHYSASAIAKDITATNACQKLLRHSQRRKHRLP